MRHFTFALVIVLAAACGGKSKGGGGGGGGGGEPDHAAHHDKLTPELSKFNDAIAPTWHAAKGEQRAKDACAAAPQLEANLGEVSKASAPAKADAAKWTDGVKTLTTAVGDLKTSCAANVATAEPALDKVHDALHTLIGMAGGHHEADGSHKHK